MYHDVSSIPSTWKTTVSLFCNIFSTLDPFSFGLENFWRTANVQQFALHTLRFRRVLGPVVRQTAQVSPNGKMTLHIKHVSCFGKNKQNGVKTMIFWKNVSGKKIVFT